MSSTIRHAPVGRHAVNADSAAASPERRSVSVVTIAVALPAGSDSIQPYVAALAAIQAVVSRAKGIILSNAGGHVVAVFNAAVRCASHATVATGVALELGQMPLVQAAAVATGNSLCGVVGSPGSMQYAVFGTPLAVSAGLAAAAAAGGLNGVRACVAASTLRDAAHEWDFCAVGSVAISEGMGAAEVAYAVQGRRAVARDAGEWMYELAGGETTAVGASGNHLARYNAVVEAIATGADAAVEQALQRYDAAAAAAIVGKERVDWLRSIAAAVKSADVVVENKVVLQRGVVVALPLPRHPW